MYSCFHSSLRSMSVEFSMWCEYVFRARVVTPVYAAALKKFGSHFQTSSAATNNNLNPVSVEICSAEKARGSHNGYPQSAVPGH